MKTEANLKNQIEIFNKDNVKPYYLFPPYNIEIIETSKLIEINLYTTILNRPGRIIGKYSKTYNLLKKHLEKTWNKKINLNLLKII